MWIHEIESETKVKVYHINKIKSLNYYVYIKVSLNHHSNPIVIFAHGLPVQLSFLFLSAYEAINLI